MKIPGYTLIRELGRGGMATVYLARQDRLTRDVALKVMKPLAMAGDDFTSRFIKEGQIIAQLQHPQIVTIYDFDTADGLHYFSMEYLPGGTLADEIKRGLPATRAIAITKKIAEALAVAHARGVIHRDVKPQNILFRADGTPVLTDFGIARAATRDPDSMQLTSYGMVIGSPRYMSPEQSTGQPLDPRADLYSLGVVFHEMLTQQLPYEADDVVSLAMKHCNDPIPRLPEHLALYQPILDKLIAKKPEARFASAGQLIRALQALEGATLASGAGDEATRLVARGEPPPASPPTPSPVSPERPARRRWLLLIGVGLILVLALLIASRTPQPVREPEPVEILDQLPPEPPDRPRTVVQYEALAIEHYRRAQLDQSLGIIRLGLAITPDDGRLIALRTLIEHDIEAGQWLDKARRQLSENRLDAGLKAVTAGLELRPAHPELLALKAEIEARIRQATRLEADRALELAEAARARGDLDAARLETQRGLDLVADHPGLLRLQGQLDEAQERERDLAAIRRAIETLIGAGKPDESRDAIARALVVYPDEPSLLELSKQVGDLSARRLAERIEALLEQAIIRHDQGEDPAALELIAEGLRLAPEHAGLVSLRDRIVAAQARERQRQIETHLEQARGLFEEGDLDGSLARIDQGLAFAPGDAALTALRDRVLARHQAELEIAERLRDCDTRFPSAAITPENSLAAQACLTRILELDPANTAAQERLAGLADRVAERGHDLLDAYRLDAAEAALRTLRALAPGHARLATLTEDLQRRRGVLPALAEIAGGCFRMGSPSDEAGREPDEHPHEVCVEGFRLALREVTVAEFGRFVKATAYRTDAEKGTGGARGCEALDRGDKAHPWGPKTWANWRKPNKYQAARDEDPVSCVSWNDAQAYLDWLNRETRLGFRLPSEAEWEYAARAGSTSARFWGEAADNLACQYSNSADKEQGWDVGFPCGDGYEWVAPVGGFKPNPWGLFDMLGNVWEWTCSEYAPDYQGSETRCAPSQVDTPRALRGGAWNSGPALVRAAYRNRNFPEARYSFIGFRLALDGDGEATGEPAEGAPRADAP